MLETRDTILVIILITVLGYYLQSGPKIGNFLSSSHVETFVNDGIVVVDNLFTPEEFEVVSKELMWRVDNRPDDVRAEDLLNLHHNDSYIMGTSQFVTIINQNPHPRPGQTPQLSERGLPAALQPPLEAVLLEDPVQAAGAEHRDPVASGQPERELLSREQKQNAVVIGQQVLAAVAHEGGHTLARSG